MLIELEKPFELDGRNVSAAALSDAAVPPAADVGYAGFGAEHFGETMRHHIHVMEMSTLSEEACARALLQYDATNMICAQGKPPRFDSACNGDSGSGLVDKSGRLVGVASWVQDDATTCAPGKIVVFSRVAAVRDWIRQTTGL